MILAKANATRRRFIELFTHKAQVRIATAPTQEGDNPRAPEAQIDKIDKFRRLKRKSNPF